MDVTVVVGTYGDPSWVELAQRRAVPSAAAQGVPVVHHHADTLHDARNGGIDQVTTEWVCHLDADDELEPGYFGAMASGVSDVRAPSVRYARRARVRDAASVPKVAGHAHDCSAECLIDGNWLVVGSLVRTDMVRRVGGWRDFPWSEDWDLWLRCHLAGATFEAIPDAVYRAHVRPNSRNRAPSRSARLAAHQAIASANGVVA
jgi:glycosyltransferase involved in cell wall biosynthesis